MPHNVKQADLNSHSLAHFDLMKCHYTRIMQEITMKYVTKKTEKNKNDKMCYIANTSVDLSAESNMERPDAGVTV